jgi:ribosomal protein L7Ae-like RNA K-turn-binding protein
MKKEKSFFIGINSITRAFKRNSVKLVLLTKDPGPMILVFNYLLKNLFY